MNVCARADCTASAIVLAATGSNATAARSRPVSSAPVCRVATTGDTALQLWGFNLAAGWVIGILFIFYAVLHVASYLALSKLYKQKR